MLENIMLVKEYQKNIALFHYLLMVMEHLI